MRLKLILDEVPAAPDGQQAAAAAVAAAQQDVIAPLDEAYEEEEVNDAADAGAATAADPTVAAAAAAASSGDAGHDSTGDGDAAAACEGLVFYTRASSTDEPSSKGCFGPGPEEVAAAADFAAAGAGAVGPLQLMSAGAAGGLNSSSQRQETQVKQQGNQGEHCIH